MAVRVHVPLRLRLPGDAPADGTVMTETLDFALDRGLVKTMDRIRSEVLESRGGYARPRPLRPTFAWRDAGGRVPRADRKRIEDSIAAAIDRAVPRLVVDAGADAAEVLPLKPSESIDWKRRRGNDYRLHSYAGGPNDVGVDVESAPAPQSNAPSYVGAWWHWNGDEEELKKSLGIIVRSYYSERKPRFAGAIFHGSRDGLTGMFAATMKLDWSRPDDGLIYHWHFLLPQFRVIVARGLERRNEDPLGVYKMRSLGTFSGPDELRALVHDPLLAASHLPAQPGGVESEEASRLRASVEEGVTQFVSQQGTAQGSTLVELHTGLNNKYYLVVATEILMGRSNWDLQGIWEMVPVRAEQEGSGESAGDAEGKGEAGGKQGGEGDKSGREGGEAGGSPFAEPGDTGEASARVYPQVQVKGEAVQLDLSAFLEEPSVNDLGELGVALKRLITRIAYRLEMPPGDYCGSFLIAAAQVMGARAATAGEAAVVLPHSTRQVAPGSGNLGDIDIVPQHTAAVRLLRFIAGTCPTMTELSRLMFQVYGLPTVSDRYFGSYRGEPVSWRLRFDRVYIPEMRQSVAHLFMRGCQVVMLQVLRSSRDEIDKRLDNFDRYFPVFEGLINGLVAQEAELRRLRETLQEALTFDDPSLQHAVSYAVSTWREARQALSTSVSDQIVSVADNSVGPLPTGKPFRRSDGARVITDLRGREWTLAELESAIAFRSQTAASIDPLINQLRDVPGVVNTFRYRPAMARAYLESLLREMRANNSQVTADVTASYEYAFRSGKIREDLPHADIPGTGVKLQGIHLLVHQAIGDAFEGNHWYGAGVDYAFDVELGRLGLIDFFETSLILALSVLCPPAGIALGLAAAAVHMAETDERVTITRAVMNPEDLFDKSELELDLFLGELELVMAVLPALKGIAKGGVRGVSVVARSGVRRGIVRLTLQARRALIRSVTDQLKQGLARAFVEEIVSDQVMGLILPLVIAPVIEAVDAELRMVTVKPSEPALGAQPNPQAQGEARPSSNEGIDFYNRLDEFTPSADDERRTPLEDQP
jgi:hypothetical protein